MNTESCYTGASLEEHQEALLVLLCEFDRICRELNIPYILFAGTMLGAVRHEGFIPWDDDLDVMMLREDYERFLREADGVINRESFYLQKEFSEHWPMFFSKLRLNGTACLEKYHPKDPRSHQGIYIDIFPCDNALRSAFGRKLQFFASKVVIAKALSKRGYEAGSTFKKLFIAFCHALPMKPFRAFTKFGGSGSETVHSFFASGKDYAKNVFPRQYLTERTEAVFENRQYPISAYADRLLRLQYGDYMTLPPPEERTVKQHAILVDTKKSYEEYEDYRDGMKFETLTRSIR